MTSSIRVLVQRISLSALLAIALAGCAERAVNLYGGLSEVEANRLVAFLDEQGIRSHKLTEREGVAVTVASSDLARASFLATQAGLPRTQFKGFGQVFPKDGLISSPLEERARLTYATSQELESMLADIEGVLGVRVNVVIPERRNGRNVDLPSAAVLIRHRADVETDLLEMKVRRLVASSVPGLVDGTDRQISVTFMPVGTRTAADRQASVTASDALATHPNVTSSAPARSVSASDVSASGVRTSLSHSVVTWLALLLAGGLLVAGAVFAMRGSVHQFTRRRFSKNAGASSTQAAARSAANVNAASGA